MGVCSLGGVCKLWHVRVCDVRHPPSFCCMQLRDQARGQGQGVYPTSAPKNVVVVVEVLQP